MYTLNSFSPRFHTDSHISVLGFRPLSETVIGRLVHALEMRHASQARVSVSEGKVCCHSIDGKTNFKLDPKTGFISGTIDSIDKTGLEAEIVTWLYLG